MSLVEEIRGDGPAPCGDLSAALRALCAALLAENRLPLTAVVAARIRIPSTLEIPSAVPQELGWSRIPVFWEQASPPADAGSLQVVAHVRVKRRRRLRAVSLEPASAP